MTTEEAKAELSARIAEIKAIKPSGPWNASRANQEAKRQRLIQVTEGLALKIAIAEFDSSYA